MPDSKKGAQTEVMGSLGRIWSVRTLVAYWFLGLCNNYGYVVMVSAAHDILKDIDIADEEKNLNFKRECNTKSTGAVLLADIIPCIMAKLVAAFIPLWIWYRVPMIVFLASLGFILVATKINKYIIFVGICCTSASCGLGESTYLAYMIFFKSKNLISTWSSGTGGAGIIGSGSYALLRAVGLSARDTILLMLVIPVTMTVTFYCFVDHPPIDQGFPQVDQDVPTETENLKFHEKITVLKTLIPSYTGPFACVFLSEYYINQGLYELLYFPKSYLDHATQYRVYQLVYQSGVFISRSSLNLFRVDYLWLLAFMQLLNASALTIEVLFGYVNYLTVVIIWLFFEGLIGGCSYVNTYRLIQEEMPTREKQFAMQFNGMGDAIAITLAGIIGIAVHTALCQTERTYPYPVNSVSRDFF